MKFKILFGLVVLGAVVIPVVFFAAKKHPAKPKGTPSVIEFRFSLPQGYQFTPEAPYKLTCGTDNPGVAAFGKACGSDFSPFNPPYKIPFMANPGKATVSFKGVFYYCEKATGMCFYETFETSFPLTVEGNAPLTISRIWNLWPNKKPTEG
jgi:hypothetical protein